MGIDTTSAGSISLRFRGHAGRPLMGGWLRAWLAEIGAEPKVAEEIVLATWVAATGVLERSDDGEVDVDAEWREGHVLLSVADRPRVRADRTGPLDGRPAGLRSLERWMDAVKLLRGPHGTRVLMCRCLSAGRPGRTMVDPAR